MTGFAGDWPEGPAVVGTSTLALLCSLVTGAEPRKVTCATDRVKVTSDKCVSRDSWVIVSPLLRCPQETLLKIRK